MEQVYEPAWRNFVNGKLIRFSNRICKCRMRAEVKIFESDNNPHKLYYKCMNKTNCGYFKWWVPERNDFNNGAFFEGNMIAVVNVDALHAIEANVNEVKTLVKKLQKSRFGERAVKMMMYLNLTFFILNLLMLKM
ncbi:hypothetical protein AB3S75_016059 [Citrus x aurantiifolia]